MYALSSFRLIHILFVYLLIVDVENLHQTVIYFRQNGKKMLLCIYSGQSPHPTALHPSKLLVIRAAAFIILQVHHNNFAGLLYEMYMFNSCKLCLCNLFLLNTTFVIVSWLLFQSLLLIIMCVSGSISY